MQWAAVSTTSGRMSVPEQKSNQSLPDLQLEHADVLVDVVRIVRAADHGAGRAGDEEDDDGRWPPQRALRHYESTA